MVKRSGWIWASPKCQGQSVAVSLWHSDAPLPDGRRWGRSHNQREAAREETEPESRGQFNIKHPRYLQQLESTLCAAETEPVPDCRSSSLVRFC